MRVFFNQTDIPLTFALFRGTDYRFKKCRSPMRCLSLRKVCVNLIK